MSGVDQGRGRWVWSWEVAMLQPTVSRLRMRKNPAPMLHARVIKLVYKVARVECRTGHEFV